MLLFYACTGGQSIGNKEHNHQWLIGGWYKSMELKRLSDPEILENLQKTWDGNNKRGSSWSAQYEGYITAPVTKEIVFYARSNQEIVLSIAGKEVLRTGKGLETDSAGISMKKGQSYPIHLVYRQRRNNAQARAG